MRKEIIIKADPPAWSKRYFTILSIANLFVINIGKKPKIDNSKPIHTINQLLLLSTIATPLKFSNKKINQDGYTFNIKKRNKKTNRTKKVKRLNLSGW